MKFKAKGSITIEVEIEFEAPDQDAAVEFAEGSGLHDESHESDPLWRYAIENYELPEGWCIDIESVDPVGEPGRPT